MVRKANAIFLLVFIVLAFASPTHAATITVSPGDNIQTSCVSVAATGDVCTVASGTYAGFTVNKPITIQCDGTCIIPHVIVGGVGTTVSGFEVTGGDGITLSGRDHIVQNNYVHDLAIVTNGGISLYYQSASSNITIRNNTISKAFNSCIYVSGSNHTIEGNDCSHTTQPYGGDADCFRIFGSGHKLINNTCHDITYGTDATTAHIDCIQTWHWSDQGGAMRDALVEGNYCNLPEQTLDASGKAFHIEGKTSSGATPNPTNDYPCRNIVFKNNIVHTNHLALFDSCQSMTITNNTFLGDTDAASQGIHLQKLKGTNRIQYNIFVDQQTDAAYSPYDEDTKQSLVDGYNCVYRSNGTPLGSPKTGDVWGADPQFIDKTNNNYHLKQESPCCSMGAYPCPQPTNTPFPSNTPVPTPTPKPGDANRDNQVNETDYAIWFANFEKKVSVGAYGGDFDGNGIANGVDYMIWYKYYET